MQGASTMLLELTYIASSVMYSVSQYHCYRYLVTDASEGKTIDAFMCDYQLENKFLYI